LETGACWLARYRPLLAGPGAAARRAAGPRRTRSS
jgi:hypothetical protein